MCRAIPSHISVDRIRVDIAGVEYEWCGGFGAVLKSRERRIVPGSTRMIAGILFHAAYVQPHGGWFGTPVVCWTIPNDAITADWIRAFKGALLCGSEWADQS